jgi:tRNA threonylcarbamoyladenosine biosynthesis protein TsaE
MEVLSKSVAQTKKLAANIARDVLSGERGQAAHVLALEGELGAGKTTFVQGFAQAFGVTRVVRSPTFVLMKGYKLKTINYRLLYHLDCYRIRDWSDLLPLGIKDIFANPENIILIEWPERAGKILPRKRVTVHFDHISEHERLIRISK